MDPSSPSTPMQHWSRHSKVTVPKIHLFCGSDDGLKTCLDDNLAHPLSLHCHCSSHKHAKHVTGEGAL